MRALRARRAGFAAHAIAGGYETAIAFVREHGIVDIGNGYKIINVRQDIHAYIALLQTIAGMAVRAENRVSVRQISEHGEPCDV